MAETSFMFDGDTLNEAAWYAFFQMLLGSGVAPGWGNELAVAAVSGLTVQVNTGQGFVEGMAYYNSTALQKTLAAQDATNNRIDTIVMRANWTSGTVGATGANRVRIDVVQGTPAASPSAPALTQTPGTQWDEPLADILVRSTANGGGTIVGGDITPRFRTAVDASVPFGTVARRPAATARPKGQLYWATDQSTLYYCDGSTWISFGFAAGGPFVAQSSYAAKGAVLIATGAGTFTALTPAGSGDDGKFLIADSSTATGWKLANALTDSRAMMYGLGEDGSATLGASGTVFLTRDMHYDTLTVAPAPNLITAGDNGTFELNATNFTGVTRTTTAGQFRTGTAGGSITGTANTPTGASAYAVTAGLCYEAQLWAKANSGTPTLRCDLYWYDSGNNLIHASYGASFTLSTSGWTQCYVAAGAPVNAAKVALFVVNPGAATIFLDDVTLRAPSIHTMGYEIRAKTSITIQAGAVIDASGSDGTSAATGTNGGGGGQGGGCVILASPSISNSGSIRARGGNGGNYGTTQTVGTAFVSASGSTKGGGVYAHGGHGGGAGANSAGAATAGVGTFNGGGGSTTAGSGGGSGAGNGAAGSGTSGGAGGTGITAVTTIAQLYGGPGGNGGFPGTNGSGGGGTSVGTGGTAGAAVAGTSGTITRRGKRIGIMPPAIDVLGGGGGGGGAQTGAAGDAGGGGGGGVIVLMARTWVAVAGSILEAPAGAAGLGGSATANAGGVGLVLSFAEPQLSAI